MRNLQTIILILLIPIAGIFIYNHFSGGELKEAAVPGYPVLRIGGKPIRVEIVTSPEARVQGLSGRDDIGDADGMFFVFDKPDHHGIWMKDMKFAIDVIWISESLEVVGITNQLTPQSFPKIFEPSVPVLYALETDPFLDEYLGLKVGDTVELPVQLR